jgi:opacity protein-like surface antigen
MRTPTLALLTTLLLGVGSTAGAADLDYGVLRGSDYEVAAPDIDWNGVYVGGHAGYTNTDFNFGKAGRSDLAQMLRSTAIEQQFNVSQANTLRPGVGHGLSFGGFFGYNYQFDETVVGVEADYTSLNQKSRSEDSIARYVQLSNGTYANYFVATKSQAALQDYATIRVRGGAIFGPFMPYFTGGVAIGRANVGNNVQVVTGEYTDLQRTNRIGGLSLAGGTIKEKYALGAALGAGVDYAITQNIFLRGEYQYVWFGRFGDHKMELHTIRSALGVKF